MSQFLTTLTTTGRVTVAAVPSDDPAPAEAIAAVDAATRAELAGDAPPLSLPAAQWALRLLEAGCRFLAYRDYDEAAIIAALATPCPERPNPSVCYSVDLFLHHLPDLVRLARGLSPEDPLVTQLVTVGQRWPLSSVGVPIPAGAALDTAPFADHPALLQLYVDRIIDRADVGRLRSPLVRQAVRQSLGAYAPDLVPTLAAALDSPQD